jgi:hypothetical protein
VTQIENARPGVTWYQPLRSRDKAAIKSRKQK